MKKIERFVTVIKAHSRFTVGKEYKVFDFHTNDNGHNIITLVDDLGAHRVINMTFHGDKFKAFEREACECDNHELHLTGFNVWSEPIEKDAEANQKLVAMRDRAEAAESVLEEVRAILRCEEGEDITLKAKVVRQLADALISLQK